MILSPQMLWKEFDRKAMPLDTYILKSISGSDFIEQSFYFNGGASASSNARVFARLYTPIPASSNTKPQTSSNLDQTNNIITTEQNNDIDNDIIADQNNNFTKEKATTFTTAQSKSANNCIIIMPDYDQDVSKMQINTFAGNDVSIMIVDWAGDYNNRSRRTIYPKSMSYANFDPLTYASTVTTNLLNSCWYAWGCTLLRAITFLQSEGYNKIGVIGIGVGSDSVWKAAAYDSSISAAACLLDSGLETFKGSSSSQQLDFLAGLQTINYAPNINCPLFMLAETNSTGGSFDKLVDEYNAINRSDKLFYILQRADSLLNENIIKDIKLWFNYYLNNVGVLPKSISLTTKKSENNLYYQVLVNSQNTAKTVDIYSTQSSDTIYRYWRRGKLDGVSDTEFIGKVNIFNASQKLLAYANITFSDGFCCSTPLITLETSQIKDILPLQLAPRRLIYDSDMGVDNFISIGSTSILSMQKGYNNISGIMLDGGCLLTYKIGDLLYRARGATSIQLIICSYSSQDIIFKMTDSNSKNEYYAKHAISPQNEWLKITLSINDFKNLSGNIFTFDNTTLLEIFSVGKILISSILWI